jgi:hypothetical protein
MLNTKTWWQSRTIWASLIAMLAGAGSLAGLHLDAPLQDELATLITAAAEVAAGATSLAGRLRADSRIIWRR